MPLRLAELFLEAGLPAGVFQVVQGDRGRRRPAPAPDIKASALSAAPTSRSISTAGAAANGKRAQCFGGAEPHDRDAGPDLDQAIDALIGAGYGSAGERCMAISVAVAVGDEGRKTGCDRGSPNGRAPPGRPQPRSRRPTTGPWSPRPPSSGCAATSTPVLKAAGAASSSMAARRPVTPDFRRRQPEGGFFIGPTLFDHVTTDMSIYTDEIFGPVLCIGSTTMKRRLRLPNEHEYGNRVAIFTRDGDTARDFVSRCRSAWSGVNVPIPVPVASTPSAAGSAPASATQPAWAALPDPVLHQDQDRHRVPVAPRHG